MVPVSQVLVLASLVLVLVLVGLILVLVLACPVLVNITEFFTGSTTSPAWPKFSRHRPKC